MSGIVAIMSLDGRPIPPELPRAQLAAIAHRGEWEPRLWEAPGIALGHVNLPRTPEAEREFLPAPDLTGRYWLTWDGRLDNRDELARKLGYDSAQGAEKTDADYVLDAFVKWGDDCVHHLLGDWAVVIWDNQARRLFCAKDPIGWRQLYYAEHDGLLAVGSEPQQFFANGWLPRVANEEYVLRFLADALQEPHSTCYVGVSELWGGVRLDAVEHAVKVTSFWVSPKVSGRRHRRPEEYVDEFEQTFQLAVQARRRSNRPVATFLSGGLDSSYVTQVAAAQHPGLSSYTLFVPGSKFLDERAYARIVATRSDIPLVEVDTTDCWYLSSLWLPDGTFDQPMQPGSAASLRAVVGRARADGIGVMLGGEGGDEWFSGGHWSASPFRCSADALFHFRLRLAVCLAQTTPSKLPIGLKLTYAAIEGAAPREAAILGDRLRGRKPTSSIPMFLKPNGSWRPAFSSTEYAVWRPDATLRAMFRLYRQTAGPEVAWRDRHVFAPTGIEIRSPLNDLRVVELLAATPEWVKRYQGLPRDILRESLRRKNLGEIAARVDKGFYEEQLHVGLGEREHARLMSGATALSIGLRGVRSDEVESEVRRWLERRHRWSRPVYRIATTGLWLSQFNGLPIHHGSEPRETSGRGEVKKELEEDAVQQAVAS